MSPRCPFPLCTSLELALTLPPVCAPLYPARPSSSLSRRRGWRRQESLDFGNEGIEERDLEGGKGLEAQERQQERRKAKEEEVEDSNVTSDTLE